MLIDRHLSVSYPPAVSSAFPLPLFISIGWMNRSVAVRTARQVASSSNDSTTLTRFPLSCWRCRLSLASTVSTSPSLSSPHRSLHASSVAHQATATSSRSRRTQRSEQLSQRLTEERVNDDDEESTDASWSPASFQVSPVGLTDLMAVARTGASEAAMDSPLHQTLVALVESGDVTTALSHLRSLHHTATANSWNLLLSAFAHRRQFDEVVDMWKLWQTTIPPLDSTLPADYNRLLLPNATTYGILLRSPNTHRLLTADDALRQLKGRGLATSTFIYNTLIKDHVNAKDYSSATSVIDAMNASGTPQDIYTISIRFTLFSKLSKRMEPSRRYEHVCELWDGLMALQLPRVPPSLGWAFVWHICQANDNRRLVQLVHAIVNTSGPPDVVHQAKPVELMLGCLMKNDRLQEMILLYRYMRRVGFKMTHKHFFVLVAGFARQGETNGMMRVFNEMVGHGVQPTWRLFETMLQAYGRVGDVQAAVRMIRRMNEFGVQPTVESIGAIARGLHERHTSIRAKAAATAEEQGVVSAGVEDKQRATPITPSSLSFSLPLSLEYLALFELTDELSITPDSYMYHRLLQALHEEKDLAAMLFFLCDMKHKGVPICLSELQWVLWQLSEMAQAPTAHVRLMVMQASLIVDGEENTLGALSSYYLLTMYIGVSDIASMQRVYRSIRDRKIRVTWDASLRLMQQCLRADSSDVREHERMQFIIEIYTDLVTAEMKFGESIYNEVLQAYAVLGDTTGMKKVLAAMRQDKVAMGEATLAVLDEAREHVLYTADIANYVTQQRNRISTLQMENNIRMRHKAELRQAAVASGSHGAASTRVAAIDVPAEKRDSRALFALPEWSPLYDQTETEAEAERQEEAAAAAAVEELQSALSAFLSSLPAPIMHAQQFPVADTSEAQQVDEAGAVGPTAKEVAAISRKIKTVKKTWPSTSEQKKQRPKATPALPPHTEAAAAAIAQRQTASVTRIQPIDGSQRLASTPLPRGTSVTTSPFGMLSLAPQPGTVDPSTRTSGGVMRMTRCGSIGRQPRFSLATVETVTSRRMKAAMTRRAEEEATAAVTTAIEYTHHSTPRSPVLPLSPAKASATFFTAIESQAEAVAIADGGKRKRQARKVHSPAAAESGASGAKIGGKQRDSYHGGWTD